MKKLFEMLEGQLRLGQDAVLATIVEQSGSAPRGAGAAMVVTKEGRLCGTVGGGAVEYRTLCMAKELIGRRESFTQGFHLKPNEVQDLGMVCGGDVTIDLRYIPANEENAGLIKYACGLFDTNEEFWIILNIESAKEGGIAFYSKKNGLKGDFVPAEVVNTLQDKPLKTKAGEKAYFSVQLQNMSRVYIFGGGHVSQALVPVLSAVGFQCVVLEDREEFCRPELFPQAESIKLIDIGRIFDYINITERDFVCIMTRGHKDDLEVQAQILKTNAYYIGVIGSRSKKASVFARLKERGFTDADLARITTPIGLDIKAETPAEIAVSITAQMILRRAELI